MSELPCLACGATPSHLHHSLPKSVWPAHRHNPDCLIPLCFTCHNDWHDGRERVTRDMLPPATWKLISDSASREWVDRWYPPRAHPALPF